jgi:hypothetical protein
VADADADAKTNAEAPSETHLSDLVFDEWLAGVQHLAEHDAHHRACERCRNRLSELEQARVRSSGEPGFERTFAALHREQARVRFEAAQKSPGRSWTRWLWAAAAMPLAVIVALLWTKLNPTMLLSDEHEHDRVKGTPSVALVHAKPVADDKRFFAGDEVNLRLGPAGNPFALVIAVDDHGEVSELWPDGPKSGGVDPGGERPLSPAFEVTPGSLEVWAFFSVQPLSTPMVLQAVSRSVVEAKERGTSPLDAQPSTLPGELARAHLRLDVESKP